MSLVLAVTEQSLSFQIPDLQQVPKELEVFSDLTDCNSKTVSKVPKQLTPFKKGQSGNPSGRPRGFAELRHGILEFYNKDPKRAIRRLYDERIDLFFAYAFGKPADRVELSGPDGGAIEVQTANQQQLIVQLAERGVVLPGME